MNETLQQLAGDFVLLDLGSAHASRLLKAAPELSAAITLVEVDPQATTRDPQGCHRRICLPRAVAGSAGPRTFKRRAFPEGSSFLDPQPDQLREFGLESYFELVGTETLDCATLPELLAAQGLNRVDLFKTDLEGLDFEILQSAPAIVQSALVIQSELRFHPFFQGEASYTEVAAYLEQLGFELIWLRPQVWKYATPGRDRVTNGRLVWTDAIFFLSHSRVRALGLGWKGFAKQVLLARLLGLDNFAEFLAARHQDEFPPAIRNELTRWASPKGSMGNRLARTILRLPGGWKLLSALRRLCLHGARQAALFKDPVVGQLDY